jgi:hypothetical protein
MSYQNFGGEGVVTSEVEQGTVKWAKVQFECKLAQHILRFRTGRSTSAKARANNIYTVYDAVVVT